MKKTTILAAFALALLSCTPKELDVTLPSQTMKLRASLESEDTRTVLSPDGAGHYQVHWASTDAISVNGQSSNSIEIDATDARIATFELPVVNPPYAAIYPASAYAGDYTEADGENAATMKVTLPAVQNYVADGYDPAAAVMLGTGDAGNGLEFKHAMAYLKVTVSGGSDTDAIKSVRVQANDGVPVSGTFTATFNNDPSLGSGVNTYSSVTLDCGSGLAQGNAMYIAIPAGTYSDGINILFIDINNHYMLMRSSASFPAVAGKIYPTSIAFNAQGTYLDAGIYTVSDWGTFAQSVADGDDHDGETVTIMNDLVVDGHFAYANGTFNGTLEGNNHTLTANGNLWPLFTDIGVNGVVRNLTIAGEFTEIANQGLAGNATIAIHNYGTISYVTNTSSLNLDHSLTSHIFCTIVAQNGGTLDHCTNTGNITLQGGTANNQATYGGGIAAQALAGAKFIDCRNEGNISITFTSGTLPLRAAFGGICGYAVYDGVEFTRCTNTGKISKIDNGVASANTASCLGGICGRAANHNSATAQAVQADGSGFQIIFDSCVNTGELEHLTRCAGTNANVTNATTGEVGARHAYTGGIAGIAVGGNTEDKYGEIKNCKVDCKIGTGWNGTSANIPGGLVGCGTNVKITDCTAVSEIVSSTATSGSSAGRYVSSFGGAAGYTMGNLIVSGGKYWVDVDVTYGSTYWPGLLVGMSKGSNSSLSNLSVGGTMKLKNTAIDINSSNFNPSWLYPTATNSSSAAPSAPSVTDVSWLASKPSID